MADSQAMPSGTNPEGDETHESDIDQSPGSVNVREKDTLLPMRNVSRIMKRNLPHNAQISQDARETMQQCATEFIGFITSEANEKRKRDRRVVINGDDLIWSMATLGLDDYVEPLKTYLKIYREFSQPTHQSSCSQGPHENSQPAHRSSCSQGPNENSQFSQPAHVSSFSQAPSENPHFSQPAHESSFSQGPSGHPQDPNMIVPTPGPES